MNKDSADRNLLFSLFGLQLNLFKHDDLTKVAGQLDKLEADSVGEALVNSGVLAKTDFELVNRVVERHLETHQQDFDQSLASIQSLDSVQAAMETVGRHRSSETMTLVASEQTVPVGKSTPNRLGAPTMLTDRFIIERPHAEGGLGIVSIAIDQELNREVALKEIKGHFANDHSNQARFLLEGEVTGRLEHPGIVPVYGMGRRPDGRPFYVMRFIEGKSLRDACQDFHSAKKERRASKNDFEFRRLLKHFVDVCNAIEYAHSRGVLHRDLKPANVMLGKFGETLVVDWGLAKAAGREETYHAQGEDTLQPTSSDAETIAGKAMGTPQFMSPEQASGKLESLGPRTDVYSLGATLFYLMTNEPPINDADPALIVAKVQLGEFEPPRKFDRKVSRSLEAICLKAMAYKPDDRYPTARDLANDVELWLADEPVSAYTEPFHKRARRWTRKHPKTVASLAATLLVGASFSISIAALVSNSNRVLTDANTELSQSRDAERNARESAQRNAEQLARTNAQLEKANEEVLAKEAEARRERDAAMAFNEFISVDLLGQASPGREPDRNVTLRTILDRTAESIETRFEDQPLVEASISFTIGSTYKSLGEYHVAEPHLVRAYENRVQHLGDNHKDTLLALDSLAVLYADMNRYEEAEKLCIESLTIKQKAFGEDSEETLRSMGNLASVYQCQARYDEALNSLEQVVDAKSRIIGSDDEQTLTSKMNLSVLYGQMGRYDEAAALAEEVLSLRTKSLGESHIKTLHAKGVLGRQYARTGQYQLALPLLEDAYLRRRDIFGREHTDSLFAANNYAELLAKMGRYDDALTIFEETLQLRRERDGDLHPMTLIAISNVAAVFQVLGRYDEAAKLLPEALEGKRKVHGDEYPGTLTTKHNWGQLELARGRAEEALVIFEEVFTVSARVHGNEHADTLQTQNGRGHALLSLNRLEEAEQVLSENARNSDQILGSHHLITLTASELLALNYELQRRHDESEELRRTTLKQTIESYGHSHPRADKIRHELATHLASQNRHVEAIELAQASLFSRIEHHGEGHLDTVAYREQLGLFFFQASDFGSAAEQFATALASREEIQGKTHEDSINTAANLAESYRANGQIEEASRVVGSYLETSEELLGHEAPISMRIKEVKALVLGVQGKHIEALPLFEQRLNWLLRVKGEDDLMTLQCQRRLAAVYFHLNRHKEAIDLMEIVCAKRTRLQGESSVDLRDAMHQLCVMLERAGRYDELVNVRRELLRINESIFEPLDSRTLGALRLLAQASAKGGTPEETRELCEKFIEEIQTTDLEPAVIASNYAILGLDLLDGEDFEAAENVMRRCVDIRSEVLADDWLLFNAQSMLGESLFGQERYEEAESVLIESFEEMWSREASITPANRIRLEEAIQRIIDLYSAWDKPEDLKRWQDRGSELGLVQKQPDEEGE